MKALLGRLVSVDPIEGQTDQYSIAFKPICVLPNRSAPPEWIKDQTLKVERQVHDLREIGHPGDSLVLSIEESRPWLTPLEVTPCGVVHDIPEKLSLSLHWWKEGDPPTYTVKVNGWEMTGKFEKNDEKITAKVDISQAVTQLRAPVVIDVEVDKLHEQCVVLPAQGPVWQHVKQPQGDYVRLRGRWLQADINPNCYAGGLCGVKELLRGQEHLTKPEHTVLGELKFGGYFDGISQGWGPLGGLETIQAKSISGDTGSEGPQVRLEGMLNEGLRLRSLVNCQLPDWAPLLIWRREYARQPLDKSAEGVQVPINSVESLKLYGHLSSVTDGSGLLQSRLSAIEDGRFVSLRLAKEYENSHGNGKKLDAGWLVVEHPVRQQMTLVLINPDHCQCQHHNTYAGCFNVEWHMSDQLVGPIGGLGQTVALAFGEQCGAGDAGAWVACRGVSDDGQLMVGIVARLKSHEGATAVVSCAGQQQELLLRSVPIPGVGEVQIASAQFAAALDSTIQVEVDDIPASEVAI